MVECLSNERKYVFLKIVYLFYYCRKMWIIRNLRCHYLQNTITNSEKIFDTNSINHFTNIAKVLRGGVSELIGNYEYLRILPQPSEVKTFGMKLRSKYFRKEYILRKN